MEDRLNDEDDRHQERGYEQGKYAKQGDQKEDHCDPPQNDLEVILQFVQPFFPSISGVARKKARKSHNRPTRVNRIAGSVSVILHAPSNFTTVTDRPPLRTAGSGSSLREVIYGEKAVSVTPNPRELTTM